jgi:DNA-binding NtrC family response regulator
VLLAENARQARELRATQPVDLVLLDIWMPDTDGVTLLREWAGNGMLSMPVIMMSGHATIDTAVEATRIGAIDFLEKPITLQKLLRSVSAGLAHPRALRGGAARPDPSLTPVQRSAALPGQASQRVEGLPGAAHSDWPDGACGAGDAGSQPGGPLRSGLLQGEADSAEAGLVHRPGPASGPAEPFDRAESGFLRDKDRPPVISVQSLPLDAPLRDARDAFERAYFEYHLQREQGSMTRVAERTGLERTHLYRKLKQLGVDLSRGAWRKRES